MQHPLSTTAQTSQQLKSFLTIAHGDTSSSMSLAPSSPRLPSPPPPTEIQIGPQSPAIAGSNQENVIEQSILEANSSRRIHPGTKASDMAAGPPLVPLSEVLRAFIDQ